MKNTVTITILSAIIGVLALALLVNFCGQRGSHNKTPGNTSQRAQGQKMETAPDDELDALERRFLGKPTLAASSNSKAKVNGKQKKEASTTGIGNIPSKKQNAKTNAADFFRQLFDLYTMDQLSEADKSWFKKITGWDLKDLSEQEKERFKEFLASNEFKEIYDLLKKTAEADYLDFNLDYSKGASLELPHLRPIRDICRLLSAKARIDKENADVASAAESLALGDKLANAISAEPVLISQLVSVACKKITAEGVNDLLRFENPVLWAG